MIILGIDPGLERIGYGLIARTSQMLEAVTYGCLTTPKQLELKDRLGQIYAEVKGLIEKHRPDVVACEQLFYFKNNKTIISVSEARGVIILAVAHCRVPLIEPTPLQVKSSLTSWGRSPKKQVQSMVMRLFNLEKPPKSDDAADALAIAYCGATLYANNERLKR